MRITHLLLSAFSIFTVMAWSTGCKNDSAMKQAEAAMRLTQTENIYSMLDGYPALKSCFNDLSKEEFENKLFRGLLADRQTADDLVSLFDALPRLFNPREVPAGLFDEQTRAEMASRGALQDVFFVMSGFFDAVLDLPEERRAEVFHALDVLAGANGEALVQSPTADRMLELSSKVMDYIAFRRAESMEKDLYSEIGDVLLDMRGSEGNSVDDIAADWRDALYDGLVYANTIEEASINETMRLLTLEMGEIKNIRDGEIDAADIEEFIKNNAADMPRYLFRAVDMVRSQEVVEISRGMKDMLDRKDTRDSVTAVMYALGALMRDPELSPVVKSTVSRLGESYDEAGLKDLLGRVWSAGPAVGPEVQGMDVEGYGRGGAQAVGIRNVLTKPEILAGIMEALHLARREMSENGLAKLDFIDDGLVEVATHDPQVQPMAAPGPFPGGKHFEPATFNGSPFSYKNFSWFRGLCALASRYSQPLSPTSTFLYEKDGWISGEQARNLIRTVMADADSLPMGSFIWCDVYEKGEDSDFGNGAVRRTKGENEYGMLINDLDENGHIRYDGDGKPLKKLIAPFFPELASGAELAFYAAADCIENGPYAHMYDNVNWLFFGRKFYVVIDIIQFLPQFKTEIPENLEWLANILEFLHIIKDDTLPYGQWLADILKAFGIKKMPIMIWEATGCNQIIYAEAGQIMRDFPDALLQGIFQNVDLPDLFNDSVSRTLSDEIVKIFDVIAPLGYRDARNGKVYILPPDLRDLWPVLTSIGFFDPQAFHTERLPGGSDDGNYAKCYDTSGYRFLENGAVHPKINKIAPLAGAFCLGVYRPYRELIRNHPMSAVATGEKNYFQVIRERQQAARAKYDGVVYPITYFINTFASLSEKNSETNTYADGDGQMPFARSVEPVLALRSSGVLDGIVEMGAILGGPEMKDTRESICRNLGRIADRMPENADPVASALFAVIRDSKADPDYWKTMDSAIAFGGRCLTPDEPYVEALAGMLEPQHGITASLVGLVEHLNATEITEEDVTRSMAWMVDLSTRCAERRIISRAVVDIADIMASFDESGSWRRMINVSARGFDSNGVMSYILLGLQKSPDHTWGEVLTDLNAFLKSDVITENGRGSFWSDMGYLARFMAQVF